MEEATNYDYSAGELKIIADNKDRRAVGTPAQVKEKLLSLAQQFKADEIMLVTITHDPAARRRSYELLASVWF